MNKIKKAWQFYNNTYDKSALLRKTYFAIKQGGIKRVMEKYRNAMVVRSNMQQAAICFEHKLPAGAVDAETLYRSKQQIPLSVFGSNSNINRINLITDSIGKESLFGGVATALILVTLFCNKYDFRLRIITSNTKSNSRNYFKLMSVYGIKPAANVEFITDESEYNDNARKIEVGKNDYIFTTSWWTTDRVRKTYNNRKIFYILQEVEPYFYEHGYSMYQCKRILEDKNIVFIINTELLEEALLSEGYLTRESTRVVFEPAFPVPVASIETIKKKQLNKKRKLFFYSRPNNSRNLFLLGVEVINEAVKCGIISNDKWEILLAGADVPQIRFGDILTTNLHVMELEDYYELCGKTDIALSLMYTPHPSYPPLDMAAGGAIVVTNKYRNKKSLERYSKNIILADLTVEDIVKALEHAVERLSDVDAIWENYVNMGMGRSWQDTLESLIVKLYQLVDDKD